jgi:hypothetical protein
LSIKFDGVDRRASGSKLLRHLAVPSANLDPAKVRAIPGCRRRDGLRRNANRARDLFSPSFISKEMLSQALPCHSSL